MKFLLYWVGLIFPFLILCQSCVFGDGSDKNQSSNNRGTRQSPSDRRIVSLPIETENEKIHLKFELNEDRTVLHISSEVPNEKIFIFSSSSGEIFTRGNNHIGIKSYEFDNEFTLNFELGQNSAIYQSLNKSIEKEDIIAETTDAVSFYMEENGRKIRFCLNNVTNEAEDHVNLTVSSEDSCF